MFEKHFKFNSRRLRLLAQVPIVSAFLFVSNSLATAQGQNLKTPVPSVEVVLEEELNTRAKDAWGNIIDIMNPQYVDQFISRFPNSAAGWHAFAVRYQMVLAGGDIDQHNEFVAHYPSRQATLQIVGAAYRLYREQHRLSGYLDFMNRYPNTPHALAALLHVQQIGFETALKLDTSDAYESYVELFPDAPQSQLANELASIRIVDEHRKYLEERKNRLLLTQNDLERTVNVLALEYSELWIAITKKDDAGSVTLKFLEEKVLGYRPNKIDESLTIVLGRRMERIHGLVTLIEDYSGTEASKRFRDETRHQELLNELKEIRKTVEDNHKQLINTLKTEFESTRNILNRGFEALADELKLNRQVLSAGFQSLEVRLDQLHQDLAVIHGDLVGMNAQLENIDSGIRESNLRLQKLDESLLAVDSSIRSLNKDLNIGLHRVDQRLENLTQDVQVGFAKQHAYSRQLIIGQKDILTVTRGIAQTSVATLRSVNTMRGELKEGFDHLGNKLDTGFTRVENSIWKSNAEMQKAIARIGNVGKKKKGGLFGKLIGAAVSTFVPGVGAALGPALGNLIDGNSNGGFPVDIIGTAIKEKLVGEARQILDRSLPGAGDVVGTLFDYGQKERAQAIAKVGSIIAEQSGVPKYVTEWAEAARTARSKEDWLRLSKEIGRKAGLPPIFIEFAGKHVI